MKTNSLPEMAVSHCRLRLDRLELCKAARRDPVIGHLYRPPVRRPHPLKFRQAPLSVTGTGTAENTLSSGSKN